MYLLKKASEQQHCCCSHVQAWSCSGLSQLLTATVHHLLQFAPQAAKCEALLSTLAQDSTVRVRDLKPAYNLIRLQGDYSAMPGAALILSAAKVAWRHLLPELLPASTGTWAAAAA